MEKRDGRTYKIIGAAMEVHQELGHGFLEAVYQDALAHELQTQGIPFSKEVIFTISYKGQKLSTNYRADFVCFDQVIVELKALPNLSGIDEAQLINYLKATGLETGLLINFGQESLQYRRLVFSKSV